MPCQHKFYNNLNLSYVKDYEPETLIIGTFNPGWEYIKNESAWFYGRKENNFWDVLPLVYGEEHGLRNLPINDECKKKVWQDFCKKHKIAITDIIECICDAKEEYKKHKESLKKFNDKKIFKFSIIKFNNIDFILDKFSSIKNVYFTRKNLEFEILINEWNRLVKKYNRINFQELLTPSNNAVNSFKKEFNLIQNAVLPRFIATEWNKKWHCISKFK